MPSRGGFRTAPGMVMELPNYFLKLHVTAPFARMPARSVQFDLAGAVCQSLNYFAQLSFFSRSHRLLQP